MKTRNKKNIKEFINDIELKIYELDEKSLDEIIDLLQNIKKTNSIYKKIVMRFTYYGSDSWDSAYFNKINLVGERIETNEEFQKRCESLDKAQKTREINRKKNKEKDKQNKLLEKALSIYSGDVKKLLSDLKLKEKTSKK